MDTIRAFDVPGGVSPKQRARITKSGHAFTPKKTVNAEAYVRTCYCEKFPAMLPISGPVSIELCFYRKPPTSWPKWKQDAALEGEFRDAMGADLDNKVKTVLDALNKVAFEDDRQIVHMNVSKGFAVYSYATVRILELPQAEAKPSNVRRANRVRHDKSIGI